MIELLENKNCDIPFHFSRALNEPDWRSVNTLKISGCEKIKLNFKKWCLSKNKKSKWMNECYIVDMFVSCISQLVCTLWSWSNCVMLNVWLLTTWCFAGFCWSLHLVLGHFISVPLHHLQLFGIWIE